MILFFLACNLRPSIPVEEPHEWQATIDTGFSSYDTADTADVAACMPTVDWDRNVDHVTGIENFVIPTLFLTTPCEGAVVKMRLTVDDLDFENADWMSRIDSHMSVMSDIDPLGIWMPSHYDCTGFCRQTWDMAPINVDVATHRELAFRWAGVANGDADNIPELTDSNPDAFGLTATLQWEGSGGAAEVTTTFIVTVLPPTE